MENKSYAGELPFSAPNLPEQITDRFALVYRIGRFEEKYLLTENASGDDYVLKRLSNAGDDSTVNEAALLRGLRHAGLPTFEPEIETESGTYILRRYIEGIPLDEYLDENTRLAAGQVVDIALRLCGVLCYIHSQSPPIIHCDISPSNIIYNPSDGGVTLIDFGIARNYDDDASGDTVYAGKLGYMPPEKGHSQTDGRSDIYSLGRVLRLCLTGTTDGEAKIADGGLARIVLKCTAFSPKDRYKSAAALERALKRYKLQTALKRRTTAMVVFALIAGFIAGVTAQRHLPAGRAAVSAAAEYVNFTEPLIEKAVRLTLGRDDGLPLTRDEVETVREIYIYGPDAAASVEDFHRIAAAAETYPPPMGQMNSLDDLSALVNLEKLEIVSQPVSDLTPLKACARLGYVYMTYCNVTDASPLTALPWLYHVHRSAAPKLTKFSCFQDIRKGSILTLSQTPLRSVTELGDISHVRELSLENTLLESLEGIEKNEALVHLSIHSTDVRDFSPLNDMPYLETLRISKDMERYLDTLTNNNIRLDVSE
jgi:hypothetical protein